MNVIDPLYRMSEFFELELMDFERQLKGRQGIAHVDGSIKLIEIRIENLKKARHACASVEELETFLEESDFPRWRSKWADLSQSM